MFKNTTGVLVPKSLLNTSFVNTIDSDLKVNQK